VTDLEQGISAQTAQKFAQVCQEAVEFVAVEIGSSCKFCIVLSLNG
jgi:hypothetical protein